MSRLLRGLAVVVVLSRHVLAHPSSYLQSSGHMHPNASLTARDAMDFEAKDTVEITKMAAIGDSYSAGIGAGELLSRDPDDRECSRYNNAYPYLVHENQWLGDPSKRDFQFKSCSGAVTKDVIDKQIPYLDDNQELILVSAGGNDVELVDILNHCVFQWLSLRPELIAIAKGLAFANSLLRGRVNEVDWDSLGRTCSQQLAHTKSLIETSEFSRSLDKLLEGAKNKLAKGSVMSPLPILYSLTLTRTRGMIYYTGYAKFFAEDLSTDCDNVTWTTWLFKVLNNFQPAVYLTKANRSTMNQLVDDVNGKIRAAVERAGLSVKFIDYDDEVGEGRGRFCETGVDESIKTSKERSGLMFYEFDVTDPRFNLPWKRSTNGVYDGTFGGDANYLSEVAQLLDPDAKLVVETYFDEPTASSPQLKALAITDSTSAVEKRSLLPDGYGRVFHPQVLLHNLIAQRIIYDMVDFMPGDEQYRLEESYFSDADSETCVNDDDNSDDDDSSTDKGGATGIDDGTGKGQQLALATYIDPGANMDTWARLINMPSDKVSVLVANVVNGPDSTANPGWTDIIPKATASGKTVLGYVRTGYLGVSFQKFTTRLGSSDTSDWIAQIQEDVDQWYRLYPGQIGGIFFDEGWNDCGLNNRNADLYKFITQETKRKYPGAYTVLNPGAPMPQCFEHSADTILTAEVSYATYTSSAYAPVDWIPSDPRKLWHIIYDVPASGIAAVAKLAKERNVGMLHITDDVEPNPYDSVPSDAYMQTFMDAVAGGKPLKEPLEKYTGSIQKVESPLRFQVDQFDYSSATLSWLVTSGAAGYVIFQDGVQILSLMPWMITVTVGGLEPNTAYSFTILAVSPGGLKSGQSTAATVKTLALPRKGRTVSSTSVSASANQAVYKAEILVPYAFVRLFIWNSNCKFVADAPITNADANTPPPDPINWGWPINFQAWYSVCNQYMVEDGKLHKYTGTPDPTTGYMPWTWTYMDAVHVTQVGYDWTWTLPLGTADMNPNKYIVQVQGYGPRANVYNKCPQAPAGGILTERGITVKGDYCI